MRNISFDNPWWLLLLIPLALGVIIPYAVAVNRDNKSKSTVASLIIHIIIVLLIGLGVAGTVITSVMTQTQIIVVADVSHSAERSLDDIDAYIAQIGSALPRHSALGVVCFGKDYILHTELGEEPTSVKDAAVDGSATDIASALDYAATLFGDDVLKRIVLITDGSETVSEDVSRMVSAVERLVAADIAIDAIYLDSNLPADVKEIQLTGVDYVGATYLNHETTADILIQSSCEVNATLSVYRDGVKLSDRAVVLSQGYNVVNYVLPTAESGLFDYEVRIAAEGDTSAYNNSYSFSQRVSDELRVLMVTSVLGDIEAASRMFGSSAELDVVFLPEDIRDFNKATAQYKDSESVYIIPDVKHVPCSVSELCVYDQFVLSNVDIRDINNVSAFVGSLETVVSQYGKSLVTFGDTKIQNKTDATLESLEDMLPVKFGNSAKDSKLFTIVIDVSRSMFQASRLAVAKQAAIHMLSMLDDDDDVIVVTFAGDIVVAQATTKASNRQEIAKVINSLSPQQGTSIGGGLAKAIEMMLQHDHDEKQVMLISDGMNYTAEIVKIDGREMTATEVASYMAANDVTVSTMNPYNTDSIGVRMLKNIASNGGGEYYYIASEKSLEDLIFSEVGDDITESVVNKESVVHIGAAKDDVMKGVPYLPSVPGYVHSKAKISATTVLTVDYTKANGTVVEVPLYSYWKYGNGRVASFTGSISGEWAANWQGTDGQTFFSNVASVNIPQEKKDYPYTMDVHFDGIYSNIEITPAVLDPYATVDVTVTHPDGREVTERLTFDASRYFYGFKTDALGEYAVKIVYTTATGAFEADTVFHISYSPEYNSFANFDASNLYAAIRHHGSVLEGEVPSLRDDDAEVTTYRLTFTVPFMISAIILYVIDIIVRKIKWADIKSLFKSRAKI
ncbi:MAG: VWA domain-containing protein [Eubacteriales bacterium]